MNAGGKKEEQGQKKKKKKKKSMRYQLSAQAQGSN